MLYPPDERINVLAPVVRGRKGEFKRELAALRARGFTRARIDGQFVALDDDITLDRRRNHTIDVLVDRLIVKAGIERRLSDSIDLALKLADDIVVINTLEGGDRLFSRRMACPTCGISIPEMTPRAFSFNSPHGACPELPGARRGLRLRSGAHRARRHAVAGRRRHRAVGEGRPPADRRDARRACSGRSASIRRCRSAKLPKKLRDIVLFGAPGRRHGHGEVARGRTPQGSVRRGLRRRRFRTCAGGSRRAPGPIRKRSSRTARCSRARPATASGCGPRAARSA